MFECVGDYAQYMIAILAKRVVADKDGESVTFYDIDHSKMYDFVYVDGPTSSILSQDKVTLCKDPLNLLPDIDVELFWENGIYPRVIVIDGRRSTVRRLIQKSQNIYDIVLKTTYLVNTGLYRISKYYYHTVFIKK